MSQDIKKPVFGNAAAPEFVRVNGKLQVRDGIRVGFTRCFTCNNMCGLRYRVDEKTNTVTRVAGNPYCEVVSGGKPLPLNTPVEKAFEMLEDLKAGKKVDAEYKVPSVLVTKENVKEYMK